MPSLKGSTRLGVPGDRNARTLRALPASLGIARPRALGQHGTADAFHGTIKATIIPQKLDSFFNGSYSYALGRVEQYSSSATGSSVYDPNIPNDITMRWPAFEDMYTRLEAALQYHFTKSLTGKLF